MPNTIVRLQPARHKRVQNGHPWVYSNEIIMDAAAKAIKPGAIVEFRTHDKQFLGRGSFNTRTLIAGRIFTRKPIEMIDADFLRRRLSDALALRDKLYPDHYYRLVHAEADGLPGLIIDRFGKHLTLQINIAGMDRLTQPFTDVLIEILKPESIILRNDSMSRELEGLPREVKIVRGEAEAAVELRENDLTYYADLHGGQKTGWYFDHRDNRKLVAGYCKDASVLDLYCHTGGFALCAAQAGAAKITGVDSSEAALALAQKAARKNKLSVTWHQANVFEDLERRARDKEKYDMVIADPPAFVKARKDMTSGARGYRKLARLCASLVAEGGLLFIASCSYNMALQDFTEQAARGLHEAGREGRILHAVFAGPDHPVHPHLPESAYLKGLLIRLD